MGDSDLSRGSSPPAGAAPVSLPDLIRAGDAAAFAGFRNAHMARVRAYCEVACPLELVGEACEAAFLDFVGRMCADDTADQSLEAVLLTATRSAAASRFPPATQAREATEAEAHRGRRQPAPSQQTRICATMPELLAARANGELRGDDCDVTHHVASCTLCTAAEARLQAAEAAFSTASGRGRSDGELRTDHG